MAEIKIEDTGQENEKTCAAGSGTAAAAEKELSRDQAGARPETDGKAETGEAEAGKQETGAAQQEAAKAGTGEAAAEPSGKAGSEGADQKKTDSENSAPTGSDKEEKKSGFFNKKKDKELEALKAQNAELNDRLKRQLAEFDNYRKRTEKEKESMFSMGEQSVAEKILPIIDNFERGLETVPEEQKDDAFVQGMEKVYQQTVKQLKAIGVTEIDAEGQKFDQNLHNAVMQAESDEKHPSGTVVQVLQKGYMYHDKVLRHSMVSVAK
ncbi:MAG: nucleotide exchange factor GrpE [Lachnospiraceae bacterium]|nr:nucleotide exchange factor GrpE [Lachnospiraceae bacterium]